VLAALLRLLAASWRIDATASLGLTAEHAAPRLVGFWHGKYFALLVLLRGIPGTVLIRAGFHGEVIAAICATLGYTAVLIARRDRERAIAQIRAVLRGNSLCATALDGPLGPARRVKASLIRLAAEAGAEIVPVSVLAAPRLVLGWRWDRREIPLPLARVGLAVGEPIAIPEAARGEQLEEWRWRVGHRIDELERPGAGAEVAPAPWLGRSGSGCGAARLLHNPGRHQEIPMNDAKSETVTREAGAGLADASPGRRSFAARFGAAFRLDASVFEEVEHDAGALPQAALVVALAGLARGIQMLSEQGWVGAAGSLVAGFLLWFAVTGVVTAIGVRMLGCSSSFLELLRTLGFAAAPLVALVICLLPLGAAGAALSALIHAAGLGALVLAVRQALDVDTSRALLVCVAAIGFGLALLFLLGTLLLGRTVT
jgi:lysophospholipid acyltransferase (LPLAT)-like uncharacterized protein